MSLLGIHLTLLIGPMVPLPAPPTLVEALQSVEVTQSDEGRSGFQLSFAVGRSGPLDLFDYQPSLARVRGHITHKPLDHVSPLAVPALLEIGREMVSGEASEVLLAEAEAELIKEAMS